jgi:hypothetical protein
LTVSAPVDCCPVSSAELTYRGLGGVATAAARGDRHRTAHLGRAADALVSVSTKIREFLKAWNPRMQTAHLDQRRRRHPHIHLPQED